MRVTLENAFQPQAWSAPAVRVVGHLAERLLKLSIPNLYVWLLMFLAIFHCWLNLLAEVTRFADREFYKDWWNSKDFADYWRRWNLPIHNFFNRHVHKPLLRLGVPRLWAGQIVFLISALAHEYVINTALHVRWTGVVTAGFLLQIPLIYLTMQPVFWRRRTLGNCFFWFSFCFTGQPVSICTI